MTPFWKDFIEREAQRNKNNWGLVIPNFPSSYDPKDFEGIKDVRAFLDLKLNQAITRIRREENITPPYNGFLTKNDSLISVGKFKKTFSNMIKTSENPEALMNELISLFVDAGGQVNKLSDGFHTFKLLYENRLHYNAAFFNSLASEWFQFLKNSLETNTVYLPEKAPKVLFNVHKSCRHWDGEYPFGSKDWFLVTASLPTGNISNHYHIEHWDLFQIPEFPISTIKYDGHTPNDSRDRLHKFLKEQWKIKS